MKVTFDFTPHELNELSSVLEEVVQTLRFRADLLESVGTTIDRELREPAPPHDDRSEADHG